MKAKLMVANRLVEATRNQVAVKRGPIVYCLESVDMEGLNIFDVILPADVQLKPMEAEIAGAKMIVLEGDVFFEKAIYSTSELYFPMDDKSGLRELTIRLIPYFAWGNRGFSEMSVWIAVRK